MKHLLIIFSLLLTSVSWSKDIDADDLRYRSGLYYEKYSDKPFTGDVTGQVRGKLKKGKYHGKVEYYWSNGALAIKSYYKKGKIEGESVEYDSMGWLRKIKIYKKGIKRKTTHYNIGGKILYTATYDSKGNLISYEGKVHKGYH